MMEWTGTDIAALGGGALTSIASYFIGRRQKDAEVKRTEIGNANEVVELWRKAVTDLQADLHQLREHHKNQEHQINNLRNQVNGLYSKVNELTHENARLRTALADAGINYESLYDEDN